MTINTEMLKDKIAGALYGVAVGDALGGPLEFMTAEQIAQRYGLVTEMIGGGWLSLRPGETTDDTAMTMAVAEGIIEAPECPIPSIGARFIRWANSGPKDIGGTCRASIGHAAFLAGKKQGEDYPTLTENIWFAAAQDTADQNHGRSGGNGALMRAVYPALYYPEKDQAIQKTVDQGRMTHWDADSDEACKIYADVLHCIIEAAASLNEPTVIFIEASDILRGTKYDIAEIGHAGRRGELNPTGYVVDSLKCALYALWDGDDFDEAIIKAANMGGDADTIAAICGGLAGALYGFATIPQEWIDALSEADRARLDAAVEAALSNWLS